MKTLLCVVCWLITASAWAMPLTFEFTGAQGGTVGSVTGTFTYESTEAPSAVDVRGLTGNTVYALQAWDFTVETHLSGFPTLVDFPSSVSFSNALPTNGSEFCLGHCIFSSTLYDRLFFTNGPYSLQLVFQSPNTFLPPTTIADWGPLVVPDAFSGGVNGFRATHPDGSFFVATVLVSGGMTGLSTPADLPQAVPEPATWLLLGVALIGLTVLRRRIA